MTQNRLKEKNEKIACAVCGEENIYSGIVFKGHCVCEDCVEYISSGKAESENLRENPDDDPAAFLIKPVK